MSILRLFKFFFYDIIIENELLPFFFGKMKRLQFRIAEETELLDAFGESGA